MPITVGQLGASLANLFEKVAWTYLQSLVGLIIVANSLDIQGWEVAAVAALPAAFTVLMNGLPIFVGLPFAVDATWRVIRTFIATFLGQLVAMPVFSLDAEPLTAALTAGGIAAFVVIKAIAAKQLGNGSAATLPASVEVSPVPSNHEVGVNTGNYAGIDVSNYPTHELPPPVEEVPPGE